MTGKNPLRHNSGIWNEESCRETAGSLPETPATIATIIPTVGEASRAQMLFRAIDSVLQQRDVICELIVVVNGTRFDPTILETLRADRRIRVRYLEEGNVSLARFHGIGAVSESEYFGFLDDDDEYLPGALATRIAEMQRNPEADVGVTNGYVFRGADEPAIGQDHVRFIRRDSLLSFLESNWFASPSSIFRLKTISQEIFNFEFKYFEWSYLFFKLHTMNNKFIFMESFTYRKYEDNPLSVSKSIEYRRAYPDFLRRLNELPLPGRVRARIRHKYRSALNEVSVLCLESGKVGEAVRFHVKCIWSGGWRFFPYTRRLLVRLLTG